MLLKQLHQPPNYVNWVFGAPETQQGYWPGHTCAVIQKENYKDDVNWSCKARFKDRSLSPCWTVHFYLRPST